MQGQSYEAMRQCLRLILQIKRREPKSPSERTSVPQMKNSWPKRKQQRTFCSRAMQLEPKPTLLNPGTAAHRSHPKQQPVLKAEFACLALYSSCTENSFNRRNSSRVLGRAFCEVISIHNPGKPNNGSAPLTSLVSKNA